MCRLALLLLLATSLASCGVPAQSSDLSLALPAKIGDPRLDSALQPLATFPGGIAAFPPNITTTPDGKVVVTLVPEVGELATHIDTAAITRFGGSILSSSRYLMKVAVPPTYLTEIARIAGVRYVRCPIRPQPQATSISGPAAPPNTILGPVLQVALSFGAKGRDDDAWDSWTDEDQNGWHDRSFKLSPTQGGISISAKVECPDQSGCSSEWDLVLVHRAADGSSSVVAWSTNHAEIKTLSYQPEEDESYAVSFWVNPHDRSGGAGPAVFPIIRIGYLDK